MLDSLVNIINTIKERIRVHRSDLEENETRTRMALIDPLLTVLGWDTSDPACVKPEYPVTGGKADYGLRNAGPTPAAFIEAKKLGEPLESHREQMTRYSNMAGVKYAGLTNGDRWELYEVFRQTSLDERRILDLSILSDPPHESALKLLLLWRPNLESGAPVHANEPDLVERPSAVTVIDRPATPPPETPAPSAPTPIVPGRAARSSLATSQDERMVSLREQGLSFAAIGAKVGLPHYKVRNALIRLGKHANATRTQATATLASSEPSSVAAIPATQPDSRDIPILWKHKGTEHHAVLQPDGFVRLEGDGAPRTPSRAAKAAVGENATVNGWTVWKYQDEQTGRWKPISDLSNAAAMKANTSGHRG